MTSRALTGEIRRPDGGLVTRGRLTAEILEPGPSEGGVLVVGQITYRVADGVIIHPTSNDEADNPPTIESPANYRFSLTADSGDVIDPFEAGVEESGDPLDFAAFYEGEHVFVPSGAVPVLVGQNLTLLTSDDGDTDDVPIRQADGSIMWGPQTIGGVADHGLLDAGSLLDDDHPQYHNNARGDARYRQLGAIPQADVTNLIADLASKATPAQITAAIDALKGSVGAAYDTLVELQVRFEAGDVDIAALTTLIGEKLPIAGGTMTGALVLSGDPTLDLHAATKQYVDANGGGELDPRDNPAWDANDPVAVKAAWEATLLTAQTEIRPIKLLGTHDFGQGAGVAQRLPIVVTTTTPIAIIGYGHGGISRIKFDSVHCGGIPLEILTSVENYYHQLSNHGSAAVTLINLEIWDRDNDTVTYDPGNVAVVKIANDPEGSNAGIFLDRVMIYNGHTGLHVDNMVFSHIRDCEIQFPRNHGLHITRTNGQYDGGDITVSNLKVNPAPVGTPGKTAGSRNILVEQGSGVHIVGGKMWPWNEVGIEINSNAPIVGDGIRMSISKVTGVSFDSFGLVAGSECIRIDSQWGRGGAGSTNLGSKIYGVLIEGCDAVNPVTFLRTEGLAGAVTGVAALGNVCHGGGGVTINHVGRYTQTGNLFDNQADGAVGGWVRTNPLIVTGTIGNGTFKGNTYLGFSSPPDVPDTDGGGSEFDPTEAQTQLAPESGTVTIPVNVGVFGNTFSVINAAQTITWDIAGDDAIVEGATGRHSLHYSTADGVPTVSAPVGFTIHVAKKEDNATNKSFPAAADNLHVDIDWRVKGTRIFYDIVSHGVITDLTAEGGADAPNVIFGADLIGWWKMDNLTGDESDEITLVPDETANGLDLDVWNGLFDAPGALLRLNALNGKKVLEFNGVDQHYTIPALPAMTAGEVWIVVKVDADPAASAITSGLWNIAGASTGFPSVHFPYTDGAVYDSWGSTTRRATGDPALSLSAAYRLYNVTSTEDEWTSRINGAEHFTDPTNTFAVTGSTQQLKLGLSQNMGDFLDGRIAEMFIINRAATGGERTAVISYINGEYALGM